MKLNCLIVDDEPIARKGIEEYVREIPFLNLIGQCENAMKAASYIANERIDLIFLDINMPKLSGIEFLKTLKNPPLVIFTTAFPEYALEGYALDVIDYLVKPISFNRFLKAAQKASDLYSLRAGASGAQNDFFFVKCDSKYERILFSDVLFIEGLQNYVVIHTREKKLIAYLTMSGVEHQLPKTQFIKVHKSYMISVSKVRSIEGNEIVIGEHRIPISRNHKEEVVSQILGNNLFKR